MANNQMRQRKLIAPTRQPAANSGGPYDPVNEYNYNEMYESEGSTGTGALHHPWLRISGKHKDALSWNEVASAFLMEMFAVWFVGVICVLIKVNLTAGTIVLNGVIVALFTAFVHWLATRWNPNHVLRRHVNGGVTLAYLLTNQIGLFGALLYIAAQLAGKFIAGGTVMFILSSSPIANIANIPVPFPVAVTSTFAIATSLLNVCVLEIFLGAIPIFVLLLTEFVNTDSASAVENHARATFHQAVALGCIIAATFQFQIYSFSDVVHGAGLFSGWNMPGTVRDTVNMAQMLPPLADGGISAADLYTDSVFVNGKAWLLYQLGVYGSALVAVLLFLIAFFFLASTAVSKPVPNAASFGGKSGGADLSNAGIQQQASQLLPPPGRA